MPFPRHELHAQYKNLNSMGSTGAKCGEDIGDPNNNNDIDLVTYIFHLFTANKTSETPNITRSMHILQRPVGFSAPDHPIMSPRLYLLHPTTTIIGGSPRCFPSSSCIKSPPLLQFS